MDPNMPDSPQNPDPFATGAQGDAPQQDFSAYEEPLPDIGGTDDETIRKINRKTSPLGRVMAVVLIGGAAGLAYWGVQQSASYDTRMDALEAARELEGPELMGALREAYAAAEHDDVKERILLNLGHLEDKAAVPLMTGALDKPGIVRRAAARALAHIGSPAADAAKPKLLEVLPTTDEKDRAQVVWALAVLREQAAVPEILKQFSMGRLQKLEDLDKKSSFDPKVIADVVGPAKLASDELITHKEKSVRVLVASALSEAATPDVVDPLVKLLKDKEPEVIRQAAAGLGRTSDPRAGAPLFELIGRQPTMRHSVLDAIGRSTSAPGIAKLIDSADSIDLKRSLTTMLAATHDPRSADTFAKLLNEQDSDIKQAAALALAELGDPRAVPALAEQAKHEDRDVALDAIDALADLGAPEVAPMLVGLLPDNPGRKSSLLKAIGKSGATQYGNVLMKELAGDDVEAASYALADLKYQPAYGKFTAQLKRPKNVDFSKPSIPTEEIVRNREIAIRALGKFGKPDPIPQLMTLIEDPEDSAKLRAISGSVLGQLADAETISTIVAKAKDPNVDEMARSFYVMGLWMANLPEGSSKQLFELITAQQPGDVRRAAALAIGYAADPANDQMLMDMLNDKELRREAGFAILLGGSEAAASKLYNVINEDREVREVLQDMLMANDIDYFNLVSQRHFDSGQVYRRLKVAEILRLGAGEITFSYPWSSLTTRLKLGGSGSDGLKPREVRSNLWKTLRGEDAQLRTLAANALGAMGEKGLLLASRDQSGPGQEEARKVIFQANRPK